MKREIDNMTIIAEVGEQITLPSQVIAKAPDGNYLMVDITWADTYVDTSQLGELIFIGKVDGYPHDVLLSVHVQELDENPPSIWPEFLDEFGLPKRDISTADIPDIDDYQYFKAKIDRRPSENALLHELKERLADKIIMARDINHMRNAIIELEKYLMDMLDRIQDLEDRMDIVEGRLDDLEDLVGGLQDMAIIGKNGIQIRKNDDNDTIVSLCSFIKFSNWNGDPYDYMGLKMVDIKGDTEGSAYPSLLWVLGSGAVQDADGNPSTFEGAARILKTARALVLEYKMRDGKGYTGITIGENGVVNYVSEPASRLNMNLTGGADAYSPWSKLPNECANSTTHPEPPVDEDGNEVDDDGTYDWSITDLDDYPEDEDGNPDYSGMSWEEREYQQLRIKMLERGKDIHQKRFDDYITRGEMMALIDGLTD